MMSDALCDAFDGEGLDDEADEVTSGVLAELGLELDGQMSAAPDRAMPEREEKVSDEEANRALEELLPDMHKRLNAL